MATGHAHRISTTDVHVLVFRRLSGAARADTPLITGHADKSSTPAETGRWWMSQLRGVSAAPGESLSELDRARGVRLLRAMASEPRVHVMLAVAVEEPANARELAECIDDAELDLAALVWHLHELAAAGALDCVESGASIGALDRRYRLSERGRCGLAMGGIVLE